MSTGEIPFVPQEVLEQKISHQKRESLFCLREMNFISDWGNNMN